MDQWDDLVGKGAGSQGWQLELDPWSHKIEAENQLQTYLFFIHPMHALIQTAMIPLLKYPPKAS